MIILKQSVGVDVSKDDFHVQILRRVQGKSGVHRHRGTRKFKNGKTGFQEFSQWLTKHTLADTPLFICMEATGVYHESLAYFLHENNYIVSIELPNKTSGFAKSLNQRSKNDAIDAALIAQMSLERDLRRWVPANKSMRELKALSRQLQAITIAKTAASNQLHAVLHSAFPLDEVVDRYRQIIEMYTEQIKAIDKRLRQMIKADKELAEMVNRLTTIPSITLRTAVTIISETDGFKLFTSRNQLLKYAGMDIKEKQSGSSVKGKSKMSKAGNSRIRRALFMPSLGHTKGDTAFSDIYSRVVDRTKIKMKGLVAVQRKLLVVMFALAKNGTEYSKEKHRT